jgi:hypothetical protein
LLFPFFFALAVVRVSRVAMGVSSITSRRDGPSGK